MESWMIERDDVRLHGLWWRGSESTVVVVPGAMADANDFIPVVDALNQDGSVLVLDRRGRGRSGPQGEDYDLSTEVDDLRAWIDSLKTPVVLVGWSLGGTIVLDIAAGDERVDSVLRSSTAPFCGQCGACPVQS